MLTPHLGLYYTTRYSYKLVFILKYQSHVWWENFDYTTGANKKLSIFQTNYKLREIAKQYLWYRTWYSTLYYFYWKKNILAVNVAKLGRGQFIWYVPAFQICPTFPFLDVNLESPRVKSSSFIPVYPTIELQLKIHDWFHERIPDKLIYHLLDSSYTVDKLKTDDYIIVFSEFVIRI